MTGGSGGGPLPDSLPDPLLDPLFTTAEAAAAFAPSRRLQGMLDFEAALARAEVRAGVIPAAAAGPIAAACDASLYDLAALGAEAALAGNTAIPMVKHLTRRVAETDADAARFVHWGATSQDAMDSGLVLQLRDFLRGLDGDLSRLADALADLARRHRDTPVVARTWLQHALPTTFGLKAATWLDAVGRDRARIAAARGRLALQFGGAAGTLAALGDRGMAVAEALADELDLPLPALPWHATRDRVLELATALGLLAGTLGTIGRDLSLLMQVEVAEAFEPAAPGRGGSSTMPHKRNPVAAAVMLQAAVRAPGLVGGLLAGMVQEHERGLGGWHAEWQALPDLCRIVAGSARHAATAVAGLEIDAARMRANLDLTHGAIMAEAVTMALGERLGRMAAHGRVSEATKRAAAAGRPLRTVLAEDSVIAGALDADALDRLFDPLGYVGSAGDFIDRALAAHGKAKETQP
ncbi:3-carboxy-cis,cis-muconate cycloisomerase [Azospirillum sp. RWY-5-1]|uniref:3-carboxy-cis,cis-muconate cycloisomerase n=1 Tax=Azospirillum oleiclasticum TaxID=2735135 RepID=A0ABX2T9A5_9PROT|nr:3-carboxy-cis,cis-muconate cycloisomerase [Azospirillum oleiclasticum]NYZ12618.1 3-carboxy-cis,cis-muconate cycloisomerase [Azospirillum oleiclasticum]NYZ19778.1 3-carboxy-cis,cis-muconate cycloisomerase [Azospirillum oleiclasticum]